jgi:phosphate transport system substrate-binding protein
LQDPRLLVACAVGFSVLFSNVSTFTYVGFYLAAPPFHLGTTALGAVFCVYLLGGIVTPIVGKWLDAIGYRVIAAIAITISSLGVLITLVPNLWLVIVGLAICSSGVFVCQSATKSYVGVVTKQGRSSAFGIYVSFFYFGGSVGAILPGLVWHLGGWPACVAMIVTVQLLTAALALKTWHHNPHLLPSRPGNEKPVSQIEQVRSFPFKPRTKLVLLLLLVAQSLALLWICRTVLSKAFSESAAAIASHLPQSKDSSCMATNATSKDRATYLQICNAMQDVLNVPNGQFFYGGTMGAAALRSKSFLNEIQIAHPDFRLRYLDPLSVPPDSSTGIKMLLNGELSFAESQRPLRDDEYRQAQERGFILKQIPVAITGAAFYTHPDLRLSGLSLNQLQAIYTGELTNWSEIGGPDLPITPISQDTDSTGSTLSLLLRDLPSNRQTLSATLHYVRDTTAAIRNVAATPGAIGFGTQAVVANQHSIRFIGLSKGQSSKYIQPILHNKQANKTALQDGSYPLMQRVFVVIRQDDTLDELAGIAYANLLLSEKGQALIGQAGYLPIRTKDRETR